MRLVVAELQLPELERLLLPTLSHQQGFLARALRLDHPPIPEWLKTRNLEGSLQIRSMSAGDAALGSLRGHLVWSGANIQITGLEARQEQMEGSGSLAVNLSGAVPQYRLKGQLRGLDYRNGTLDLTGVVETGGLGSGVILNARSEGTFSGSGIELAPDTQVDEASGDYHLDAPGPGPRLVLPRVQLTQGVDVLHGQGASTPDGRLVLELTTGRRQVRLTGMLLPVHPVPAP